MTAREIKIELAHLRPQASRHERTINDADARIKQIYREETFSPDDLSEEQQRRADAVARLAQVRARIAALEEQLPSRKMLDDARHDIGILDRRIETERSRIGDLEAHLAAKLLECEVAASDIIAARMREHAARNQLLDIQRCYDVDVETKPASPSAPDTTDRSRLVSALEIVAKAVGAGALSVLRAAG